MSADSKRDGQGQQSAGAARSTVCHFYRTRDVSHLIALRYAIAEFIVTQLGHI